MLTQRTWVRSLVCLAVVLGACSAEPLPSDIEVTTQTLGVSDCPAGTNIIQGTAAANTLIGTAGRDCILGLGGNDTIYGYGGDDVLIGGLGSDTIRGGDGDDLLYGEADIDVLEGEGGNDSMWGGDGGDTLRGGLGNDRLFGEAAVDKLYGDQGDDTLDSGAGNDSIWGGDGHDAIQGGTDSDVLNGENGNDAIAGLNAPFIGDTISGGGGTDQCSGCELAAPVVNGCVTNASCALGQRCVIDLGMCMRISCTADLDGDFVCDDVDGCPTDSGKSQPGVCGCGVSDVDSDADGTPNCNDGCPSHAWKTAPGICGCGFRDIDSDSDGSLDCLDGCPYDAGKQAPGGCGCGVSDADDDSDTVLTCVDRCPGQDDRLDADGDTIPDCLDQCAGHDDLFDADHDGVPDGCDTSVCTAASSGPTVLQGDVYLLQPSHVAALAGVECITGSLYVSSTALTDLVGLDALQGVAGEVEISNNGALTSLDGLGQLTSVGGRIRILNNAVLGDLGALSALTDVNDQQGFGLPSLWIAGNSSLPVCWVWMLQAQTGDACGQCQAVCQLCNGNAGVGSCGELPPDFECEPGARGPGVLDADVQINPPYISPASFGGGLRCVTGNVTMWSGTDADLSVLAGVEMIGGSLSISSTDVTELASLEALTTVGRTVTITSNPLLHDLTLWNLTSVGSVFNDPTFPAINVSNNPSLPACWPTQLQQQTGVACSQGCPGNTGAGECIEP